MFLASPIDCNWFQRPRFVNVRSLSSASESWEAMAVRAFEDMFNIFSKEAILAALAFGDMDNTLNIGRKMNLYVNKDNESI